VLLLIATATAGKALVDDDCANKAVAENPPVITGPL
jgi:hypothetical protein